jgi:hypothetical protein
MDVLRRSSATLASLWLAALLAACTGYKTADPGNLTRALNGYFAMHDDCLYKSALRFPYETSLHKRTSTLDALTHAGLLERKEELGIQIKRYSLTTYAQKQVDPRFCYGHRQVTGIDSFTPPMQENGQKVTRVTYNYKMMDVPGWAKSKEMSAAFPSLAKDTSSNAQDTAELVLMVNGWRVPE